MTAKTVTATVVALKLWQCSRRRREPFIKYVRKMFGILDPFLPLPAFGADLHKFLATSAYGQTLPRFTWRGRPFLDVPTSALNVRSLSVSFGAVTAAFGRVVVG